MHATQVDTLLPFKAKAHTQAKEIERLRDETAAMHKALQESHGTSLVSAECLSAYGGNQGPPRGTMLTCVGMPGLGLLRVGDGLPPTFPPRWKVAHYSIAGMGSLPGGAGDGECLHLLM